MNWTRVITLIHLALYRATGGWIGGSAGGLRMLLLTTRGRRSGLERTLPLAYFTDGDDLLLVASNGGSDRHPAWFLNLKQDPQATIQIGRETRRVRGVEASAEQRARLWPRLVRENPIYGGYERKTRREIPVVLLQTRD